MPRGGPDQRELGIDVKALQEGDVAHDGAPVAGPSVLRPDPVDAQPAILVDEHAHEIHVPGGDGSDRRRVARAIEDPPALDTGVLGPRAVDPLQMNGCPAPSRRRWPETCNPGAPAALAGSASSRPVRRRAIALALIRPTIGPGRTQVEVYRPAENDQSMSGQQDWRTETEYLPLDSAWRGMRNAAWSLCRMAAPVGP